MRSWVLGTFQGRSSALLHHKNRPLSWLCAGAPAPCSMESWIWGKVTRRFPGGPAVMVACGDGKEALVSEEAAAHLHEGEKRCFQVVQEARGHKGPRLSTHLRLIGRLMIYHVAPHSRHHQFPKHMPKDQQKRLTALVAQWPDAAHWQWRSLAAQAPEACLHQEAERLRTMAQQAHLSSGVVGQVVHLGPSLPEQVVREARHHERLMASDPTTHAWLKTKVPILAPDRQDTPQCMSPQEAQAWEEQLLTWQHTYQQPKLPLPSGGYLIVNPTEGMTVVDINTGNNSSRHAMRQTNQEAADALVPLLAVCTLQGTIAVDFVDQRSWDSDWFQQLKQRFQEASLAVTVHPVPEASVVLLTRKVLERGVNGSPCTHCQGTGRHGKKDTATP